MPKATWNGAVLAQAAASEVQKVEGNIYFPPGAVNRSHLRDSQTHTVCQWKGTASYYDVVVEGKTNADAAWTYPETKPEAAQVKGYVAFWKGVKVED
ncbi:MAG: DUF427 domain-containing protein [Betaproteobacteria bacterium]|nr:DUF427 domain-containing protein [Betaproteobacteria bacterium]